MNYKFILFLCILISSTATAQSDACPGSDSKSVLTREPSKVPTTIRENPLHPRPRPNNNNDRIIYWCHGLGGDPTSWARVGGVTQSQSIGQTIPGYPARKVASLFPSYQQFSFSTAAADLHNKMISMGDPICAANGITDKTINFAVGHSQGGLVARATDKMLHDDGLESQRRFGGIVTFGSAHGGAMILNNEALMYQMGQDACTALIAGPADEQIQGNPIVNFFIPNETFQSLTNGFCSFAANYILPIAFKDQQQPITEDYKVGAAGIGNLNGYASALPKVAFYGVEEEPVFYRVMYNLMIKKPNDFLPFEANPDNQLVDVYSSLLATYKSKYEENKARVEYLESIGLPCNGFQWAFSFAFCAIWDTEYWQKIDRRNAYKKGYDWLLGSNDYWKTVIGARTSSVVQGTAYECYCGIADGSGQTISEWHYPVGSPADCPQSNDWWQWCNASEYPVYYTVFQEKENDGVVIAESAAGFPGAPAHRLAASNHQQMRNDVNTKQRMLEVFAGTHGDYFVTAPR